MTQRLSTSTKLKLLMPILYAAASSIYFTLTWPPEPKAYHFIGTAVALVSFMLWIAARVQLGNAFSIAPKSKFLVKSGLYSKLRHPVYYFSITAVAGLVIFTWQLVWIIPLTALIILEVVRMRKEETLLSESFGGEYIPYKRQTWL